MPNVLDDYILEADLAADLAVSKRTLKRWRDEGRGPSFTKVGARILYRCTAIADWLREREQR
jgi:hypothetical protein